MARSVLDRWMHLLADLGVADEVGTRRVGGALVRRYDEPHRRYHSGAHLQAVLESLDELRASAAVCFVAAYYHDAVYDPTTPGNEEASADLAARELSALGVEPDAVDAVIALVLVTATHESGHDPDAQLLCDADLSILATSRGVYDQYTRDVRDEYGHVEDELWRVGRGRVLQSFLDREAIYATAVGHQWWEDAARANLRRELDRLTAPGVF